MDEVTVRTTAMLVRDLLEKVVDDEWNGEVNTACHCHPEYEKCCPSCGAMKYPPPDDDHEDVAPRHLDSCKLAGLITEARAFLEAENVLAEARYAKGEDEEDQSVWIP